MSVEKCKLLGCIYPTKNNNSCLICKHQQQTRVETEYLKDCLDKGVEY